MQEIIDDVKMGNPVSECLERLYRDEVNQDFYKCYGPTEKDDNCKKPLHPGKVANDLTDVRFWMDLQERYDEYMENNK